MSRPHLRSDTKKSRAAACDPNNIIDPNKEVPEESEMDFSESVTGHMNGMNLN